MKVFRVRGVQAPPSFSIGVHRTTQNSKLEGWYQSDWALLFSFFPRAWELVRRVVLEIFFRLRGRRKEIFVSSVFEKTTPPRFKLRQTLVKLYLAEKKERIV